jgi:hypothetical protein
LDVDETRECTLDSYSTLRGGWRTKMLPVLFTSMPVKVLLRPRNWCNTQSNAGPNYMNTLTHKHT